MTLRADLLLGPDDQVLLVDALTLWTNWIETGDVLASSRDVVRLGGPVRGLHPDQVALLVRVRRLRETILSIRFRSSLPLVAQPTEDYSP